MFHRKLISLLKLKLCSNHNIECGNLKNYIALLQKYLVLILSRLICEEQTAQWQKEKVQKDK